MMQLFFFRLFSYLLEENTHTKKGRGKSIRYSVTAVELLPCTFSFSEGDLSPGNIKTSRHWRREILKCGLLHNWLNLTSLLYRLQTVGRQTISSSSGESATPFRWPRTCNCLDLLSRNSSPIRATAKPTRVRRRLVSILSIFPMFALTSIVAIGSTLCSCPCPSPPLSCVNTSQIYCSSTDEQSLDRHKVCAKTKRWTLRLHSQINEAIQFQSPTFKDSSLLLPSMAHSALCSTVVLPSLLYSLRVAHTSTSFVRDGCLQ